jgi:hypothetical protein
MPAKRTMVVFYRLNVPSIVDTLSHADEFDLVE